MNISIEIPNLEGQINRMNNYLLDKMAQPVADTALAQINRSFTNQGQPGEAWPPKKIGDGEVLEYTGALEDSFYINNIEQTDNEVEITIRSNIFYAPYHQYGFKTNGPNFIPLNYKAKMTHRNGANPASEGLVKGIDYIMAWKGVRVPARKMIDFSNETNQAEIVEVALKKIKE